FIGLRSGVGDTYAYINIYKNLPSSLSMDVINSFEKDRGFFILSVLFKQFISSDYHVWLFVITWISGLLVVRTLYKYSENFFYSLFLFIVTVNFVWMLNGMRQFLALSVIFGNLDAILDKKFFKYLILVLFATSIHITAIITLPMYFLYDLKAFSWQMIVLVIVVIIAGINMDYLADIFSIVLEDSAYEGYLEVAATSSGSNVLRVVVGFAPVALAFIGRKHIDNQLIHFCINMSIISAIFYLISSFSGGILIGRLPVYFDMFNLLLLPWLVNHLFVKSNQSFMYLFIGLCYFAFFYMKAKVGMDLTYESDILNLFL
ncbi:MAG: EpsG family protein, partial [Erysipelotrichaceae bacterium]|nr:EpsG family protein [Erysipelotrichaceae bacterium]